MTKRKIPAEIDEAIKSWVASVIGDRESLLDVALSQQSRELKISIPYLISKTGMRRNTLISREKLLVPVLDAMREVGVIVPGHCSSACEWRRRLLAWYEKKTIEERKSIKVFGGSIKIKGYLDKCPGLAHISPARSKYKLVADTCAEIEHDLRELGVLDFDYRRVKERVKIPVARREDSLQRKMDSLMSVSVSIIEDVVYPKEPFLHVLHLFGISAIPGGSSSTRANYAAGYKMVREYLYSVGASGDEPIGSLLGISFLPRYREFLQGKLIERKFSSAYANNLISAARSVMKRLVSIKGFDFSSFLDAPGFSVQRETEMYSPYTPNERKWISDAVLGEIDNTNSIAKPYKITGIGVDPVDSAGRVRRGCSNLDNARWIFENKFDCSPVVYGNYKKGNPYQKAFLYIIKQLNLPLREVYKQWGVLWRVDARALAPYIARLAQVTGLNADSLASLELDDFIQSHDLTGRPCLLYWKERSNGQKMYHLDLFHAEIAWLTTSQGREVRKIFDDVIFLTKSIRSRAKEHDKNKLFIFQSSSCAKFGEIKSVENSAQNMLIRILAAFAKDHALKDDKGRPLALTPARFRPSFVSELVELGVSIREIQVMLGHKSIKTTLSYLDRMQFNKMAREKLNEALRGIHLKTLDSQEVVAESIPQHDSDLRVIFRSGLATCRDPLSPPEFIQRSSGYRENAPCSQFNKCLTCSNSVITASHLPELFALRRDYRHLIEVTRVLDTPYGTAILENLDVLGSILSSESSDFSQSELELADRLSANVVTSVFVEGVSL